MPGCACDFHKFTLNLLDPSPQLIALIGEEHVQQLAGGGDLFCRGDAGGGAGSGYGRGDDLSSGAFNREDDLINHERTLPDNAGTVPSQPEAMMSLNFDDLESKLDRKTLRAEVL